MKQADDLQTLELPGLEQPTTKRGRGRPRKADALTPAQRAKRYRDRKAAKKKFYSIHKTAIMYRGPNGETWSGRGQVPKWLQVQIERGRSRSEFLAWNG